VVGAIDICQRHSLVDVATTEAARITKKLTGIRIKGQVLSVLPTDPTQVPGKKD